MASSVVVALLVSVSLGCVFAAVPKCDSAITSRMSEFHPKGIPTNIMATIKQQGLFSYVAVSSAEATFLGLNVRCIGISIPDLSTAQVTYKLSIFPKIKLKYPIREENGVLIQKDTKEYKLYVIYLSDAGVIFTYRCCDKCTEKGPNVGIAVADDKRNDASTKAAFSAAKAKMVELGLDKDVVDLPYCS